MKWLQTNVFYAQSDIVDMENIFPQLYFHPGTTFFIEFLHVYFMHMDIHGE